MELTELNLDTTRINGAIRSFATNTKFSPTQFEKMTQYAINVPGQPQAILRVYNCKNLTTTLDPSAGSNQELSTELALHVKKKCQSYVTKPLF
ncbi:hypothetical protein [Pedobacter sp. MC2016-24]|uniref:hypothetical protein n=1 Tax=Pedobacter sp. MC2016-24 TaxID=2780090 RepID=UPI0018829FCF|nr:hypothetical protein [Pedobacter sp. MC2016-24]MBE9602780.1 hypothetical protein [Pedobacter sp. MC2016-24]